MKATLIAAGLLGLWIESTGVAGDIRAEHHIFLVDISGSMLKAKGATPSPIHVRQEVLRNWFKTNPSSSVTLISFNTDIGPPQTFKLANANELAKALQWINELQSKKSRGTYLWRCLSKTLHVSTEWIKQHPEDSVVVHVLTDRLDTERAISFADAIKDFAEVTPRELLANGGGDFELRIVKKSEETTTNGGLRPNESTPTPTATATPIPTPTSPSPTSTPTPTTETVTFEIQEPRIVSSGQFVHFVNKTSPPADSYFWTIRENPRRCDSTNVEKTDDPVKPVEVELAMEHLVYQFCNPDTDPRSYTVFLTATRHGKPSVSSPISILVQASRQTWAARVQTIDIAKIITDIGTVFTGICTIVTTIGALRSKKKSDETKTADPTSFAGGVSSKKENRYRTWLIVFLTWFLIFGCASFLLSAARNRALVDKTLEQTQELKVPPPTRQQPLSGQGEGSGPVTPLTVINNIPSNLVPAERLPVVASSSDHVSIVLIVLATVIVVLALIAAAEFLRRKGKEWPTSYSSRGSLIEQLSEIDKLGERGIIAKEESRNFREAILNELRKRYGVTSKDSNPTERTSPSNE